MSNTYKQFDTPILFIVFNRPYETSYVFETIKKKNLKTLCCADGPRHNFIDDLSKVNQVREIATKISWECELKTLFNDKNLVAK